MGSSKDSWRAKRAFMKGRDEKGLRFSASEASFREKQ